MQKANLIDFEDKIKGAVAMPQARPEFVNSLWKQLEEQPLSEPKTPLWPVLRPAWLIAGVTAFVILFVLLAVGPQRVLAAVQSLFSYLPGVGIVKNVDEVVVLSEPIQVERDGYTVTVENLVASRERTWLRIKVEGWRKSSDFISYPELQPAWPQLDPGNQQPLMANTSDFYVGDALYAEYQFSALPENTDEAVLLLPQLPQTLKGEAPENWEFRLQLRPVEPQDLLPDAWARTWSSSTVNGVAMNLLQAVQDADGTYLTIRFDTPTLNGTLSPDWYSQLSLKDDKDAIYPVNFVEGIGGRSAIFQTRSLNEGQEFKMKLARLLLVDEPPLDGSAPSFLLDLGPAPAIGQHWKLDQTLESGAFHVRVVGATLQKGEDGYFRLTFDVERPDESVQDVMFRCSQPICYQSTTGAPGNKSGAMLHPVLELNNLPANPIPVELGGLSYSIEGPWEVDWQPLALPENIQQPVTTVTATPSMTSTENIDPQPTLTGLATLSPRETIAEEVRTLLERGFQTLYGQPGWVHVVYETIEPEDTENYQSGRLLGPSHSIGETWQYVEQDGTISKEVWIEKTPEGDIWQQSARVGTTQVNFTTGTAMEDTQLETKARVENLPDLILRPNYASDVIREETILDGQPCLLVTLASRYDPPLVTTGISQPVVQSELKTWIDQKSGLIRMVQTVSQLEDGTSLTIQMMSYPVKERVEEPPQEVLDLLQRVKSLSRET